MVAVQRDKNPSQPNTLPMNTSLVARFQLAYPNFQLDVDLTLPSTGITAITGHSGSGKTTLLRCIAGLQHPPHGLLTVNDHTWQDSQRRLFVPPHQRPLGYVFQEANLFAHLSVKDNLAFGVKRLGKPKPTSRHLDEMVALLGIGHLLTRKPDRLSGGERQRVAIARALAVNPAILLMDEPLASLDETNKQGILPFLRQWQQSLQIPMLYITHAVHELASVADYVVVMAQGHTVQQGKLTAMLPSLGLAQATGIYPAKTATPSTTNQLVGVVNTINYRATGVEIWLTLVDGQTLTVTVVPHQAVGLQTGQQVKVAFEANNATLSVI
jgi:molybdenum ABC transporter ATP-binding protein